MNGQNESLETAAYCYMCVCVCLGLQVGLYWDRRPLYGPLQIVPGSTDLTGIFPLSGVSQPLRIC